MNEKVTLLDILNAREDRQAQQRRLLILHGLPVISMTVMSAGSIKRTEESIFIAKQAVSMIENYFGSEIKEKVERDLETGYEALFSVYGEASDIKKRACELELTHPLGRFMDIDVVGLDGKPLNREDVGFSGRKCLICDKPARDCMRNKTHGTDEVNAVIKAAVMKEREKL